MSDHTKAAPVCRRCGQLIHPYAVTTHECTAPAAGLPEEPKYIFTCLRPGHTDVYDKHVLKDDYDALRSRCEELLRDRDLLAKAVRDAELFGLVASTSFCEVDWWQRKHAAAVRIARSMEGAPVHARPQTAAIDAIKGVET